MILARLRFILLLSILSLVFIGLYIFDGPIIIGQVILVLLLLVGVLDVVIVWLASNKIKAERRVADRLSLGDEQEVIYSITNDSKLNLNGQIVDELPFQFQHRTDLFELALPGATEVTREFIIRPVIRGLYEFGNINIYVSSKLLGLVQKRISFNRSKRIPVYPSFIQMKHYDLMVFSKTPVIAGIKRIRKVGESDEFEHIRTFVQGDHIRSVNWKATSRRNEIMINQFQDTRSQSVYCILDKGRSMKMPFDQLTLLDYAINSALVLSNIILKKYDRAGLITFNQQISSHIRADNRRGQLQKITEALYDEETGFHESNFQSLYFYVRKKIRRRSFLLLFSNFEHIYDVSRVIPYLKRINQLYLLVVVFFTNTELLEEVDRPVLQVEDIYQNTFARKTLLEKERIAEQLRLMGIQVILTEPEQLSINVINKYLEIKAKRMA